MLIRHLAYFVTLAEVGHFARAAALCNVTQSTLSATIRKLEDELQATLIVRGNRYRGLTADGERVLEWGRVILFDYDSLRQELAGTGKRLSGTLRLGVIPAAMPAVPALTGLFARAHPQATIDVRAMTSRAIERGLTSFDLDGGLTYLENEPLEDVQCLPLYREHYVFACRGDHPLATRRTLTWQEALAQPLCLLGQDMQNRRILDAIAASVGLQARPAITGNSNVAVCAHVHSGHWCSIVPHTFAGLFGKGAGLALVELEPSGPAQLLGLVVSDRVPQSPMTRALLGVMRDVDFEQCLRELGTS